MVGDSQKWLARYKLPRNRFDEIKARTTFSPLTLPRSRLRDNFRASLWCGSPDLRAVVGLAIVGANLAHHD
jgi:hypothetical protein